MTRNKTDSDNDFCASHDERDADQDDNDPGDPGHVAVCDGVGEELGEVEKDAAAVIEDEDTVLDFEVFSDGAVEGI